MCECERATLLHQYVNHPRCSVWAASGLCGVFSQEECVWASEFWLSVWRSGFQVCLMWEWWVTVPVPHLYSSAHHRRVIWSRAALEVTTCFPVPTPPACGADQTLAHFLHLYTKDHSFSPEHKLLFLQGHFLFSWFTAAPLYILMKLLLQSTTDCTVLFIL